MPYPPNYTNSSSSSSNNNNNNSTASPITLHKENWENDFY